MELRETNPRIVATRSWRDRLWAAWDEARFAFRTVRAAPGVSLTIVASLAIVIGANTAIFGLLDAMFLRRLAVPHPEQLVALRPAQAGGLIPVSYQHYTVLRSALPYDRIEALRVEPVTVATGKGTEDLWIDLVSGGFFRTVGVRPLLGRTLIPSDEVSALPVVVVSEDFWRRQLGADSSAIGRTIRIEGDPYTVVGVMPASYHGIHFARQFKVAAPITVSPDSMSDLQEADVALFARRPPSASRAAFEQSLDAVFKNCCLAAPLTPLTPRPFVPSPRPVPTVEDPPLLMRFDQPRRTGSASHVFVDDASRGIPWNVDYRAQYRTVLIAVMAGVLVLLLIACANVATLLLTRAESREREFAVRIALGSGRGRLGRRLLIEALELAVIGTAIGVLVGRLGAQLLVHEIPTPGSQLAEALSWRTSPTLITFTIGISLLCTVLAGVWPARRAARTGLLSALNGAARLIGSNRAWTIERLLVTSQIALAVVLIVGAALFERTLQNLTGSAGGYHDTRLILVALDDRAPHVFGTPLKPSPMWTHWQDITQAVRRVPGVADATMAVSAPILRNVVVGGLRLKIPNDLVPEDFIDPGFNEVAPGFFAASGIGIVRGREFRSGDFSDDRSPIIVSESFARDHLGIKRALGAELVDTYKQRHYVIVGVAGDAQYDGMTTRSANLRDPLLGRVYLPLTDKMWSPAASLIVRPANHSDALFAAVRRAIDATGFAKVRKVTTVQAELDAASVRERFAATLGTLFGLIALTLAAMGVFGVLAYSVARRTREIGVRLAIGAQPRDAQLLIVRHAARTAITGILIGLPAAAFAARSIQAELYGVSPGDPVVGITAVLLLLLIALGASIIPARRAARIDPVEALRAE